MILSNLVCISKYKKSGFNYYSNKIISSGKFIFEKSDISNDAQREDLSDHLWELSNILIDKIIK